MLPLGATKHNRLEHDSRESAPEILADHVTGLQLKPFERLENNGIDRSATRTLRRENRK
jgi:hypothetical protein